MALYTIPSQGGTLIPIETIRDKLSMLDVVWADKFESENISPENATKKESEFYRGAPPQWLNFYWAERDNSTMVRRHLYNQIQTEIDKRKHGSESIAMIKLFHSPGSGGSTLAMQILWDRRKELRCAKVIASSADTKAIASQVVDLFNAGGPQNQNTVLLLLDNTEASSFVENLEDCIVNKIKEACSIPVVILLCCFRQTSYIKTEKKQLSYLLKDEEHTFKEKFVEGEKRCIGFHALNIMKSNYSPSVVKCILPVVPAGKLRNAKLMEMLALLNYYVPGSYLTYDQCKKFLDEGSTGETSPLEEQMEHFTDILVIFSAQEGESRREDKCVQMAHYMIADQYLQLVTMAGATRSEITRKFIAEICINPMPPNMLRTIKQLLTKRQTGMERKDNFSKLIQDISHKENQSMCISVLKEASEKMNKDAFLPQALARFYYIEVKDFKSAENWAKTAINRELNNSFIRDTLGQVYKNQLKNTDPSCAENILQIGQKATEAFNEEAKIEQKSEREDHDVVRVSTFFNNRGLFSYLTVANTIFDKLTALDNSWSKVLTKETSPQTGFIPDKCKKYTNFLISLRDEVEKKFEFFERYLTYSKPSIYTDEPSYFWSDVNTCYENYVTQKRQEKPDLQILKEMKVSTFVGLYRACSDDSERDFNLITHKWRDILSCSPNDEDVVKNYILANIILSKKNATSTEIQLEEFQSMLKELWDNKKKQRSPEFYLLVLLLFWPDGGKSEENLIDISECVTCMCEAFEGMYKNYLRSRYLVPLFLLREGQGLKRFIHTLQLHKEVIDRLTEGDEEVDVADFVRVEGEMRNYNVFIPRGQTQIRVSPNRRAKIRDNGPVSFYLGFSIKGPVAYNIRKITAVE